MASRVESTAEQVTTVAVGAGRKVLALAGRATLVGVSAGLSALESSANAKRDARRYADIALGLLSTTPLGVLLPQPSAERTTTATSPGRPGPRPTSTSTRPATATATSATTDVAGPPPADLATHASRPSANGSHQPSPAAPKPATTPGANGTSAARSATAAPTTPSATSATSTTSATAAEVGAPGVTHAAADDATGAAVRTGEVPAEPSRADLPIANFDEVSLPSLRGQLRRLSLDELVILREWEQAHAHRLPVVTMLDNRIAKLANGQ